jgi:uncharacterized protein YggU (UPF0235/DUF167 family)
MVEIYAKVNTGEPQFNVETGPMLKISLTEKAENGRANAELILELTRILEEEVAIIKGHKSSRKKLKVELTKEVVDQRVEQWEKQQ